MPFLPAASSGASWHGFVKDTGKNGIAIVLESDDVGRLKEISETINEWEEILELNLACLNWEQV
jgi:hypothetical protein